MSEKSGPMPPPTSPPLVDSPYQQGPPPPPYSPYPTVTEIDASKPYPPPEMQQSVPIGFLPSPQQIPVQPVSQPPTSSPPGQQPQFVQATTRVIVTPVALGPDSIRMTCPYCQADMNTATIKDPSILAWISSIALCVVGCFLGCCLIPFCMDSCKNTEHRCANCKKFIGKYSRC